MSRRPKVTYDAPVLSIDLAAEGWEIWPCNDCLPWHLEVIRRGGEVFAREWHAAECPALIELLEDRR